ncbi:MAG: nuclear transport factor 2 family protein [Lysobacterales bacterium]|nr:MAG: nuclear transport factor 2 family protein [Xanthomonadales bacterium]
MFTLLRVCRPKTSALLPNHDNVAGALATADLRSRNSVLPGWKGKAGAALLLPGRLARSCPGNRRSLHKHPATVHFRCLDTANFDELSTLFHDDVSVDFVGGNYEWKLTGKQEYLASLRKSFTREAVGHHNGHHPEIQILSESEATGIWYLADDMWIMTHKFHTKGTAMYWDRYAKADGRWKIRETRYRRI